MSIKTANVTPTGARETETHLGGEYVFVGQGVKKSKATDELEASRVLLLISSLLLLVALLILSVEGLVLALLGGRNLGPLSTTDLGDLGNGSVGVSLLDGLAVVGQPEEVSGLGPKEDQEASEQRTMDDGRASLAICEGDFT